ncbi:MAG TPA: chemotaxis response regulator protein-glutamate methylesterase [Pseudolabrys sp.]|nr:chemotaxis response regulator protein-glutamate methylesterase [Pseudolabrys sp.]
MNVAVSPSAAAVASRRIRVMLVDDAVVVRGLFARWVDAEPDLEVVATLRTGRDAVNQVERVDPDVVVLDVDMPDLDGISALPLLLKKKPHLVVIMASTLTRRNAEISLRALSLGAADYIPKPGSNREVGASTAFRRDLIEKIRQLGLRARRKRRTAGTPRGISEIGKAPSIIPLPEQDDAAQTNLRPMPSTPPRVLVIGASTGGPQALNSILANVAGVLQRAPVLITQHMPATFTAVLAEHLARVAKGPVREGIDGEEINVGGIYLAPGGKHMKVARRDGVAVIAIEDGPLVNFCKPAVDPLFKSAADVWGSKVLGLVLTGMGSDGLAGAKAIVAAGGHVLAQDEATSAVWGMPGQVTNAGLCSAVLPLPEIGGRLTRIFGGDRP